MIDGRLDAYLAMGLDLKQAWTKSIDFDFDNVNTYIVSQTEREANERIIELAIENIVDNTDGLLSDGLTDENGSYSNSKAVMDSIYSSVEDECQRHGIKYNEYVPFISDVLDQMAIS